MVKHLIKCLFLCIPLYLIMGIFFFFCFGTIPSIGDHPETSFFFFPLFLYFICWLFSAIIEKIAISMSFMYWLFCFAACLITLIYGLQDKYNIEILTVFELDKGDSLRQFFSDNPVIGWQATLALLLVPGVGNEYITYRNTAVTVYSNGVVKISTWLTRKYNSSTFKKLLVLIAITVVASLLYHYNHALAWLSFALEGGYTLVLTIINAKYFFAK